MMRYTQLVLAAFFWGAGWSFSCLGIITASDSNQLTKIASEIGEDACVVWDIHYTLIRPKNKFLSWSVYNQNKDIIEPFMEKWSKKGKLQEFLDLLLVEENPTLIDASLPILIDSLHKKGIPQFGITSLRTHPLGSIMNPALRTSAKLNNVGIDFGRSVTDASIKAMETPGLLFQGGIAFTNGANHFLKALSVYQLAKSGGRKKIYLFDDQEKFLVDMEKWFPTSVGFEFVGVRVDLKESSPDSVVDRDLLMKYWQDLDAKFNLFASQT